MGTAAQFNGGPMLTGGIAEVGELYAHRAGQVRRLVRHEVRAPEPVIEDACQVAWIRLVGHRERVHRDAAVAWLVTTARHEAFRLIRRASREVPLDGMVDDNYGFDGAAVGPSPEEIVEARMRLQLLRSLSERQRRLVWLQGLGLSYAEMAELTDMTPRTVERQLIRARRKLALAAADADAV
jgi:RNA polymerase sigma-70 factor (ECF subfamily)